MLQQVLRDMYIDPVLLSELDEEQKQLLFFKMREEQLRRWKVWEATHSEEEKRCPFKSTKQKKTGKKSVGFMTANDGSVWTWVMGDHPNDKSIEQLLEEEAQAHALKLAEEEMSKKVREESDSVDAKIETEVEVNLPPKVETKTVEQVHTTTSNNKPRVDYSLKPLLRSSNNPDKDKGADAGSAISSAVRDMTKRRSIEIFHTIMIARDEANKKSNEDSKVITEAWLEQEKIAKQAEEEKRNITKTVIERYKESVRKIRTESQVISAFSLEQLDKPELGSGNGKNKRAARPENIDSIVSWFREEEEPRGAGLDPKTGRIAEWFHGPISREDAEELLSSRPPGSFLVRVSEKIWGYAITYRTDAPMPVAGSSADKAAAARRCKHFLIDTSGEASGYQFFGANHIVHESLADLVRFHATTPISFAGQEFLKLPCGQKKGCLDYDMLFKSKTSANDVATANVRTPTEVSHL